MIRCDRGLHNRGIFYKELAAAGVQVTNIGLEAPYQLGSIEKAGKDWKMIAKSVVRARHVTGIDEAKLLAAEVNCTKNDMLRVGGFSPTQWVLGRVPRRGAGFQGDEEGSQDVGSMQA